MTHNNDLIAVIKTQATLHRGCNRAWLQGHDAMVRAGFSANARYDIDYQADCVVLRLNPDGKRKVSATGRGATLDLVNKKMNAYDFSGGISWIISAGQITVTGA